MMGNGLGRSDGVTGARAETETESARSQQSAQRRPAGSAPVRAPTQAAAGGGGPLPAVVDDPRWAALIARDASADGRFFYSVETTGVYCKPSCAARAPRPEHVAFHDDVGAAERAGFRPCKRCRPDGPSLVEERRALV
ncbi:MAG TPA: Ada metal-binding domain-containing protein, partial [Polyangiaceae bacterium]|nr:Ada metal-binding domain-containing protein [Polyangiaceae bacterium]